jgi:hypothetical protein
VVDIATFILFRLGFHTPAATFRTAWFVESAATELVVMLVPRQPALLPQLAGRVLLTSSVLVATVRAARLAVHETGCCSFFTFSVVATGDELRLDVAVPEGQTEVLDAFAERAARLSS